mgnify:FL=1
MKVLTIIALILLIIIIISSHFSDINSFLKKENTSQDFKESISEQNPISEEQRVEILKRLKELGYVE